jgi:hypothetical protein
MSFINNGYKKAKSITITKYINGVIQTPITYWVTDAFDIFLSLTDSEYQKLSNDDFIIRINAFITYVCGIEIGLVINSELFKIFDNISCPITI